MGHDQLWKDVLWTFFEAFIRLFFPEVAEALDFSTAQLVEGEVFTDLSEGSLREPDVVVQVKRSDGETEIILVHVEVQAERRRDVPYRMWEYYGLLRLRKKLPVFPKEAASSANFKRWRAWQRQTSTRRGPKFCATSSTST